VGRVKQADLQAALAQAAAELAAARATLREVERAAAGGPAWVRKHGTWQWIWGIPFAGWLLCERAQARVVEAEAVLEAARRKAGHAQRRKP